MKTLKLCCIILTLPIFVACVTTKDMDRLYREINTLHTEVLDLKKQSPSRSDLDSAVDKLNEEVSMLMKSNANVAVSIQDLARTMELLQSQLTDSNRRLADLSQKLAYAERHISAISRQETRPDDEDTKEEGEDIIIPPETIFRQSYQDYMQGNYELCVSGFTEYLKDYPDTQSSDDAYFYIGECHWALKNYREAIKAYDALLTKFPLSELSASARLKKGFSYFAIGDKPQGVVEMQYVIYEYPNSEESKKAKAKLEESGIQVY